MIIERKEERERNEEKKELFKLVFVECKRFWQSVRISCK